MAVTKLHPEKDLICSRYKKIDGYNNLNKEWIYYKSGSWILHLCTSLGLPWNCDFVCPLCGTPIPPILLFSRMKYVS